MTAPLESPTGTLVAQAWLRNVAGMPAGAVGRVLPKLFRDGAVAPWAATGFVTTRVLQDNPLATDPRRVTVVEAQLWAVTINAAGDVSAKPRWNLANKLGELVIAECRRYGFRGASGQPLAVGPGYALATVLDARALTGPREVPNDPAQYARMTMDVQLTWVSAKEGETP